MKRHGHGPPAAGEAAAGPAAWPGSGSGEASDACQWAWPEQGE